jgi:DivIVA domain-containing protein
VELDRKTIQNQDFSSSRRGYDPAEVDRHLGAIADAVEDLKRSSTAGTAAERVKGIIEAAERSAEEIERGAREKAGTVGEELAQAERRRDEAQAEADEQLRRAEEAAGLLEQAVAELERVRTALAALPKPAAAGAGARADSRAHTAILDEPVVTEPEEAAQPAARKPKAKKPAPREPAEVVAPDDGSDVSPAAAHGEPTTKEEAPESPAEAAYEAAPAPSPGGGGAGVEGARLIALNMALSGTPREETARYLAENFELDDTDAMLDDVYSRVGG